MSEKIKKGLILKELEARRYINKSTWLQSFLYDMDLLPEQLDSSGEDFNRMMLIKDIEYKEAVNIVRGNIVKAMNKATWSNNQSLDFSSLLWL